MTSSKEYRDHAAECQRMARASSIEEERACLIALAHFWTKTAEQIDRQGFARNRGSAKPMQASRG
jgi:hypothetical protein